MKIFFCFCFFCFSIAAFSQQDTLKIDPPTTKKDSTLKAQKDSVLTAKRDSALTARRDSIVNSVGKELGLNKGKMESVLTAFATAADNMNQVSENDELNFDEKSTQLKAIADQRDATLKSLVNENQLAKIKAYTIRRKIPRKM